MTNELTRPSNASSFVARDEPPPFQPASKIQTHHLQRLAVVYVRQSTQHQVLTNRESTLLQYQLSERAEAMGWPKHRVLVIDDDLGLSGSSAERRTGFQRLLAEVSLDHVGIVLGIEMSRLARCNKDWHQLLELCAMFHALLADQDGLYDPLDFNDRLVLGLKGTMSEAELHILRNRLAKGLLNKARRGELFTRLPIGYVFGPSREVQLEPDEQAQGVVRLIFEKFSELGTVSSVVRYLIRNQIQLGIRPHYGPHQGQLEWHPPCRTTVLSLLHHPMYAGAYSYGRRGTDSRRQVAGRPGTGRVMRPMEEWQVLLQNRVPYYISWDEFLENQRRIADNRARCDALGAPREGPALLKGLVVCGRCHWRMTARYGGKANRPRYQCRGRDGAQVSIACQGVAARSIDELVSQQLLQVLQTASLELSLQAADDIQRERDRLEKHWQQRLERARYDAQRMERQYQAVEPENRLVARELEGRWEEALLELKRIEEEYDRFRSQQPTHLTEEDRTAIRELATDIPALWHDSTTTIIDRVQIVRHLIDQVVINAQGETEYVDVTIHWAGGFISQHEVIRPVRHYEQLRDFDQLMARVLELRKADHTSDQIAKQLNEDGFHLPKHQSGQYTAEIVRKLLSHRGLTTTRARTASEAHRLQEHEWWLSDLAQELEMPVPTLHSWHRRGWVEARQLPGPRGQNRWILWADPLEVQRLRKLRACPRSWSDQPFSPELTTPRRRANDGGSSP